MASNGAATPPFVQNDGGYAEIPQGGGVTGAMLAFDMLCTGSATATLQAEVISPDGGSDSFNLQLDDGTSETWHLGQKTDWAWSVVSPSISVTAGTHTVKLLGREDGVQIRALTFASGFSEAGCTWQEAFATSIKREYMIQISSVVIVLLRRVPFRFFSHIPSMKFLLLYHRLLRPSPPLLPSLPLTHSLTRSLTL